jgi:hypothetical protein
MAIYHKFTTRRRNHVIFARCPALNLKAMSKLRWIMVLCMMARELQSAPVFTYVLIDIPDLHHTQVPGLLQSRLMRSHGEMSTQRYDGCTPSNSLLKTSSADTSAQQLHHIARLVSELRLQPDESLLEYTCTAGWQRHQQRASSVAPTTGWCPENCAICPTTDSQNQSPNRGSRAGLTINSLTDMVTNARSRNPARAL